MQRVMSHCGCEFRIDSNNKPHCTHSASRCGLKLPKSTYFALLSAIAAKSACKLIVYAGKLRKNIS